MIPQTCQGCQNLLQQFICLQQSYLELGSQLRRIDQVVQEQGRLIAEVQSSERNRVPTHASNFGDSSDYQITIDLSEENMRNIWYLATVQHKLTPSWQEEAQFSGKYDGINIERHINGVKNNSGRSKLRCTSDCPLID